MTTSSSQEEGLNCQFPIDQSCVTHASRPFLDKRNDSLKVCASLRGLGHRLARQARQLQSLHFSGCCDCRFSGCRLSQGFKPEITWSDKRRFSLARPPIEFLRSVTWVSLVATGHLDRFDLVTRVIWVSGPLGLLGSLGSLHQESHDNETGRQKEFRKHYVTRASTNSRKQFWTTTAILDRKNLASAISRNQSWTAKTSSVGPRISISKLTTTSPQKQKQFW